MSLFIKLKNKKEPLLFEYESFNFVELSNIEIPLGFKSNNFLFHPARVSYKKDHPLKFILWKKNRYAFSMIKYAQVYVINPVYFEVDKLLFKIHFNGKTIDKGEILPESLIDGENSIFEYKPLMSGHFDLELVKFTINTIFLEEENEDLS